VFCGFINTLEDSLGVHVDVLTYDSLKDSLISDAVIDEVILYER
jgi:predicted nucleotidyltransferase